MKFSIYLLALIAVLAGLFLYLKPETASPPPASTASQPASSTQPSGAATPNVTSPPSTSVAAASTEPQVLELAVRRGQLVSGPTVIQVHKGDEVIIHLTSDAADELHLHGYDLHLTTRPNEKATLRFSAMRTGRFGYELHHANAELGALEVYPR